MGLFTSLCKECHKRINWFLTPPTGYVCKECGMPNSPSEIEDSWCIWYNTYQEVFKYFHTHTLDQVKDMYRDNIVAMDILNHTAWKRSSPS